MTSNTDLTAEARAEAKDLASDGAREIAGLYTRLADALEVAQGRITELEAENADLDSIARVNAMNFSDWQQAQTERERATADRDALAATLDAIRATAQRWIDGDPLNKWGDHTPHFLGLKLRALLGTVPADHLNTVKAEHVMRQVPPWPPYPEADYMESRWECECGWQTCSFRDVKGHPDVPRFRALADAHLAEYRTEQGEQSNG